MMRNFAEAGIHVTDMLQAIITGGNVLATLQGARKQRRRVPEKQERLIRLIGARGTATLDHLRETFPKEWATIAKRRQRQPTLLAERDFFRNVADLVGRTNAALLAGYEDAQTGGAVLARTGGRYVGFVFDYQEFTVSWRTGDDLARLAEALPHSSASHVPLTQASSIEIGAGETPAQQEISSVATANSSASVQSDEASDDTVALPIEVQEDPVTGVWSFDIAGHHVEIERKHGLVKLDGHLHRTDLVKELEEVHDLPGKPLEFIKRIIAKSDD